jgi:hypothetical protein
LTVLLVTTLVKPVLTHQLATLVTPPTKEFSLMTLVLVSLDSLMTPQIMLFVRVVIIHVRPVQLPILILVIHVNQTNKELSLFHKILVLAIQDSLILELLFVPHVHQNVSHVLVFLTIALLVTPLK